MATERTFRVRLIVKDLSTLHNLDIDNGCMPMRRRDDGMIELQAIAAESAIAKLRRRQKDAVLVEVLGDFQAEGEQARKLVSGINRYAEGALPSGPGSKGPGRVPKREGQ